MESSDLSHTPLVGDVSTFSFTMEPRRKAKSKRWIIMVDQDSCDTREYALSGIITINPRTMPACVIPSDHVGTTKLRVIYFDAEEYLDRVASAQGCKGIIESSMDTTHSLPCTSTGGKLLYPTIAVIVHAEEVSDGDGDVTIGRVGKPRSIAGAIDLLPKGCMVKLVPEGSARWRTPKWCDSIGSMCFHCLPILHLTLRDLDGTQLVPTRFTIIFEIEVEG